MRKEGKKKSGLGKYIAFLVVVFILAGFAGAFVAKMLNDTPEIATNSEGLMTSKDKVTVMIMGVDRRQDDVGRSDTLMVATLDPNKNQAALLSIPRDTRVKIKGHGFDKINAAYAYGGEKLTQQTVENLLNTNMDHYMLIDINGFVKIIDALGGIDIDVEKRMVYDDPWDDNGGLHIDLQPGMQHMDGKTAVTYVRYRDEEGDIGRIKRQQKFMKAIMDKIVSPTVIPKLPSIVTAVYDTVETDMSIGDILSFLTTLKEAKDNGLKSEMVPGKPVYIEGISYWIPDIKKTRQILADTLGIKINNTLATSNKEDAMEYQESIPSTAVEMSTEDRIKEEIAYEKESRLKRQSQQAINRDKLIDEPDTVTTETDIPKDKEFKEPSAPPPINDNVEKPPVPSADLPVQGKN